MEVVYKELKNKLRPLQRPQIVSNRWTMRAKTLNEILIQQQHTIQTKLPNNTFSQKKTNNRWDRGIGHICLITAASLINNFSLENFSPCEEDNLSLNSLNFELFSPDPTRPPAIASSNIKFTTFFAFQPIMLQQLLKCLFFFAIFYNLLKKNFVVLELCNPPARLFHPECWKSHFDLSKKCWVFLFW